MKKKLVMFLLGLVAVTGVVFGQAQNPECMTNLSIFSEHAKVKNYDAALEPWKMVKDNCPELHVATYVYGERILKAKIKKASGADKDAFIDMLLSVYDDGHKYFPKKFSFADASSDKALLMFDEKMGSDEDLFNLLDEAFKNDRANFHNPKALYLYFSVLVDLHNAGSKDLQLVFDTYDNVTEKIDEEKNKLARNIDALLGKEEAGTLSSKETRKLNRDRINSESYKKISGSIDAKLGNLADCEKLIPLYQKNFETKKTDAVWLKRAAGRMDAKECTDDPLFVQLVEALHALDPSADSAYYLGLLNDKKGKSSEAIKYYNEAVELQTDKYKKAKILYKIATKLKKRGQKSSAYGYAKKVLQNQPSMGAAYLLIASLYADSANECGSTPFEKRSIYWKAAEYARKAARVDPSIASKAKSAANSYDQRAPSKQDIFTEGMSGKVITFSCWVGGSVTVPTL